MPPRMSLAVVAIGGFVALAVWGVRAPARATRFSPLQRLLGGGLIVLVMPVLSAWVMFVWPAYWD